MVTNPTSSTQPTATASTRLTSAGSSLGSSSSSGGSQSSPSSTSSAISNASSQAHLGSGAIAGIAVGGAIVIAVIIFILWKSCSRKSKPEVLQYAPPSQQPHMTYDPAVERPLQSGSPPITELKPSRVYAKEPRIHEVTGDNGPLGRAEMEN
jgi:hypothetical protein